MKIRVTLTVEMTDAQRDDFEAEYGDRPTRELLREYIQSDMQQGTLGQFATITAKSGQ